jgi:hypothetical protein
VSLVSGVGSPGFKPRKPPMAVTEAPMNVGLDPVSLVGAGRAA